VRSGTRLGIGAAWSRTAALATLPEVEATGTVGSAPGTLTGYRPLTGRAASGFPEI
jgi:hypothetical protein